MSRLEVADILLDSDEPTYGMKVWEADDGFCTKLTVIRNDLPVNLVIHHGVDKDYSGKIPPMFVPSLEGENPVGLMLQMSEEHRHDLRHWWRVQEMKAESTLIQDAIRRDEQARLAIRNQSVLGPYQTTQRNGHNHSQVLRDWWSERAEKTRRTKHYKEMQVRP